MMTPTVQRLNSIKDLREIDFGHTVSKHSLILFHWFANAVDINSDDVIGLTFDPNKDYGSHHYGNYQGLLEPLPRGYQYYTVGKLSQDLSVKLPDYVVKPPREYVGRNKDRIIVRVWKHNTGREASQRIDRVYITEHYDPEHTYQVTTNLLRQIRNFSVGENQMPLWQLRDCFGRNADDFQLSHIRHTWGDLACLGLLLFIVMEEKSSTQQRKSMPRWSRHGGQTDHTVQTLILWFLLVIVICHLLFVKDGKK